jgi:hypothetical protein
LIGLGGFLGALAGGAATRTLGTARSLSATYLLGTAAVALILLSTEPVWISLSVLALGFFLLACVALSSEATSEIVGAADQPRSWGFLTLTLGVGITIGSYALAWMVDAGASYHSTFVVAALGLALAFFLTTGSRIHRAQP